MKRKILSFTLALCMVLTLLPGVAVTVLAAEEYQITVEIPVGDPITLTVSLDDLISAIKGQIYEEISIPESKQRLYFGARRLEDDRILADYNIQKGVILSLVVVERAVVDDEPTELSFFGIDVLANPEGESDDMNANGYTGSYSYDSAKLTLTLTDVDSYYESTALSIVGDVTVILEGENYFESPQSIFIDGDVVIDGSGGGTLDLVCLSEIGIELAYNSSSTLRIKDTTMTIFGANSYGIDYEGGDLLIDGADLTVSASYMGVTEEGAMCCFVFNGGTLRTAGGSTGIMAHVFFFEPTLESMLTDGAYVPVEGTDSGTLIAQGASAVWGSVNFASDSSTLKYRLSDSGQYTETTWGAFRDEFYNADYDEYDYGTYLEIMTACFHDDGNGDFTQTTAPTCTTDGVLSRETDCTLCGGNNFPIPALGHDYESSIIGGTCIAPGYDKYVCSRDESHVKNVERYVREFVIWMGADFDYGWNGAAIDIYINNSYKATVTLADNMDSDEYIFHAAPGDTVELKWKKGSNDVECLLDMYYKEDLEYGNETDDWSKYLMQYYNGEFDSISDNTTLPAITVVSLFDEDNNDLLAPYAPLGHSLASEWTTRTAATCVAKGEKYKPCGRTGCNHEITDEIAIDPDAHTWGEWATTTEPTASEPGVKTRSCTNNGCTATDTGTIPVLSTYTVQYNLNGGSGTFENQTKVHGTDLTLSGDTPTRTGYTFQGWNTAADGSGDSYAASATYSANAAATLYAQWKLTNAAAPNITTQPEGGTVYVGATKTLTVAATGDSLSYQWYINTSASNSGGTAVESNGTSASYTVPTDSTGTFYYYCVVTNTNSSAVNTTAATHSNAVTVTVSPLPTYTVQYDLQDGSGTFENQTKVHDTALTLHAGTPTKTGYTFQGWATTSGGTVAYAAGASYTANAAATLYAVWAERAVSGITVISPPKAAYAHGDELDLSALILTVKYDNGSTAAGKNYAEFLALGGTISYENGAILSCTTDDNQKVEAAIGGISKEICTLTVYTPPRINARAATEIDATGAKIPVDITKGTNNFSWVLTFGSETAETGNQADSFPAPVPLTGLTPDTAYTYTLTVTDAVTAREYSASGSFRTTPASLPDGYTVSGKVDDGSQDSGPADIIYVSIEHGNTVIASASGASAYKFSFSNLPNGIYNLVCDNGAHKVTRAVTVTGQNVDVGTITMTSGKTQSVVEIKPDTPPAAVDGLPVLFDSGKLVTDDDKGITAADMTLVSDKGGTVEVKLIVEAMAEEEITDEKAKIEAIADGQTIALYLDLSVLKSRFDSLGTPLGEATKLTELQSLLTITFELPEALRGQNNLAVYRVHNGDASAFPKGKTAANSDGEYFDISDNIVTLVVNKFSTYAIGYTPQSNQKSGGSGGGTVIAQPIITMPKDPEGGSASLSSDSKTVTFTPDEGWEIADVTIDGKSVGAVESHTFTDSKNHTVSVTFRKIEAQHLCDAFTDIKTHWGFGDICYVVENRLFNGTSTTLFSPDTPMNRGMIVTVLWRLEGEPAAAASEPFTDVLPGAYYHDAVAWASETDGIVLGYGDGRYGPDDDLTREQIAAILWRYAKYKDMDVSVGEDTNILSFGDALDVSEYAIPAMQWACGEGIITGKPGNLLDPPGKATRAEVAAMLHRFLEQ